MPTVRRLLFAMTALSVMTFGGAAIAPTPAFACSCMQSTIGTLDTMQHQIFVATAGPPSDQGVPMEVERWFAGPGAAPVVTLSAASFGDSAGCGVELFPAGSRWILSAWAGDPTQGLAPQPVTGLCQPHAALDSPEGQAMLAEAALAYGPGVTPGAGAGPSATPTPTAPSALADPSTILIVAGVIGLAIVGLGLVYVLGRDRTKAD